MTAPAEPGETAVFGGSFDPPHVGHVLAARYALEHGGFEVLFAVPVFAHAFDKTLSAFEHRVKMAELAFAGLPRVTVSRVEEELGAPSRSLRTIDALAERHPGARFRLVVGSDVLRDKDSWYRWDELVRKAPPFVLGRAGAPSEGVAPAGLPEVSSTEVRALLRSRPPPRAEDPALSALVPRTVLDYIDAHGLYS